MKPVGAELFREPQRRFPHVEIAATAPMAWPEPITPVPVPDVEVVGAGRELTLDAFLDLTSTTAFAVVVDDVLVHERYVEGFGPADRLLGNSATKSALALLTGLAVDSGAIPDVDSPVCDFVPELRGSGYDEATLRHVLTMTTGLDWAENYFDPHSRASQFIARYREGRGGMREAVTTIPAGRGPGSGYAYCSPDSIVLDWVRERATGKTYPEALAELLRVVGAEYPAVIGYDAPVDAGGIPMSAGALGLTARDWARIGVLQIDGRFGGAQVVSSDWVEASSRPERTFLRPGRLPSTITTHAGFGYHWWPLDDAGTTVMADGMQGQFVYVDKPRRTVVVKTSAWPYEDSWWDRQCRDLSYLALPAIAAAFADAV